MEIKFTFTDAEVEYLDAEGYTPDSFIRRRLDDFTATCEKRENDARLALYQSADKDQQDQLNKIFEAITSKKAADLAAEEEGVS